MSAAGAINANSTAGAETPFDVPERFFVHEKTIKIMHRSGKKTRNTIDALLCLGYVTEHVTKGGTSESAGAAGATMEDRVTPFSELSNLDDVDANQCLPCLTRTGFAIALPQFQCSFTVSGVHMRGRLLIAGNFRIGRMPMYQIGSPEDTPPGYFVYSAPEKLAAKAMKDYLRRVGWNDEKILTVFKGLNGAQYVPFDRPEIQNLYSKDPYCSQTIADYIKRWLLSGKDLEDRAFVFLNFTSKPTLKELGLTKHLAYLLLDYLVRYYPRQRELFTLLSKQEGLAADDQQYILTVMRCLIAGGVPREIIADLEMKVLAASGALQASHIQRVANEKRALAVNPAAAANFASLHTNDQSAAHNSALAAASLSLSYLASGGLPPSSSSSYFQSMLSGGATGTFSLSPKKSVISGPVAGSRESAGQRFTPSRTVAGADDVGVAASLLMLQMHGAPSPNASLNLFPRNTPGSTTVKRSSSVETAPDGEDSKKRTKKN